MRVNITRLFSFCIILLALCALFISLMGIDSYFSVWKHFQTYRLEQIEKFQSPITESSRHKAILYSTLSVASVLKKSSRPSVAAVSKTPSCDSWFSSEVELCQGVTPQIKLDPDRFLYPEVVWGPNNQLIGLYQSIYMAIRLNRTLVIPRLHGHPTQVRNMILAEHRFDIRKICSFVSTISIKKLRENCQGSFNVALQAYPAALWKIREAERETGMKICYGSSAAKVNGATTLRLTGGLPLGTSPPTIPTLPPKQYNLPIEPWVKSDISTLKKLYETEERCAIYVAPFWYIMAEIAYGVASPLPSPSIDANDVTDADLYSAVIDAARHAPCLVDAARLYIQETFDGEKFVAIHWRYDHKEWLKVMINNKWYRQLCEDVKLMIPADIAKGVVSNLTQSHKTSDQQWKWVYIAAPPASKDFTSKVYDELRIADQDLKKPRMNLESFLHDKFESCWTAAGWENVGDIISTVEMEIMVQSDWFFYSYASTWSDNVRPMRSDGGKKKKYESSVYELAKEESLKRMKKNS